MEYLIIQVSQLFLTLLTLVNVRVIIIIGMVGIVTIINSILEVKLIRETLIAKIMRIIIDIINSWHYFPPSILVGTSIQDKNHGSL